MTLQTFGRIALDGLRPLTASPVVNSNQASGLRNAVVFVVVGRRTIEAALPVPQFRDVVTDAYVDMTEVEDAYSLASAGAGQTYESRTYYVHIPVVKHGYDGMDGENIGQVQFPSGSGGAYAIAVYRNVHPDVYEEVWSHILHEVVADPGVFNVGPNDRPSLTISTWTTDQSPDYVGGLGVAYAPGGDADQGQPGIYETDHGGDGITGYRFGIMNVGGVDGDAGYVKRPDFYLRSPTDPVFSGGYQYSLTLRRIALKVLPDLLLASPPSVASVIQQICARANLPAERIDVSLLPYMEMEGLAITNEYAAAESLRALGRVFLFDDSSYDAKVHFVPRGGDSVATIVEDDMVDDDGTIQQAKRSDGISIPRVLNLNYYDNENGGLSTSKQTSTRAGDRRAVGDISLETPIVMRATLAAQTVDIQHKVMIEEAKGELKFSLPDSLIGLTTADPIIVQWDGKSERALIGQVDIQDGYQEYTCLRDRQSAYTSNVEGIPPPRATAPPSNIPGATLIELLDIHILKDADDNAGIGYYLAVASLKAAWGGALIELSYDGGANYADSATSSGGAVIGDLVTELAAHPQEFPDTVNTVTVQLNSYGAELAASDLAGMMNRVNLAIIGDELVNFASADDLGGGQWELSYFLRGRKGTAPATHAIGTRFVLLNRAALAFVPASVADISKTLTFRATSFGAATDSGTVASIVFAGRTQIERQPAYLAVTRSGSNLVSSWQGVGRLGGGAAVAEGARFTGYRVEFDDGVHAVISVDTAAQTLTQNVSGLSSPVTVRVFQLNSLTGEGPAAEVIVA